MVRGRVELPSFCFSGRRSYQLSYLTMVWLPRFELGSSGTQSRRAIQAALQPVERVSVLMQSEWRGSNARPPRPQRGALPLSHTPPIKPPSKNYVGLAGFGPAASSSRTKRATKLRHNPWSSELFRPGRLDSRRVLPVAVCGWYRSRWMPCHGSLRGGDAS